MPLSPVEDTTLSGSRVANTRGTLSSELRARASSFPVELCAIGVVVLVACVMAKEPLVRGASASRTTR